MMSLGIRTGILIACLMGSISGFCQTPGNVTGNWKTELKNKTIQMEIYLAADSAYYGKMINDNSTPSKNGTIILKKLKYDKESQTFKGIMHPHDADIDLDVTVTEINKDRLKMIARKLLISRTVYLTRIK